MIMIAKSFLAVGILLLPGWSADAQENRPLSPRGSAAVHALGRYVKTPGKSAPAVAARPTELESVSKLRTGVP